MYRQFTSSRDQYISVRYVLSVPLRVFIYSHSIFLFFRVVATQCGGVGTCTYIHRKTCAVLAGAKTDQASRYTVARIG